VAPDSDALRARRKKSVTLVTMAPVFWLLTWLAPRVGHPWREVVNIAIFGAGIFAAVQVVRNLREQSTPVVLHLDSK
jgi:hypothetical protein